VHSTLYAMRPTFVKYISGLILKLRSAKLVLNFANFLVLLKIFFDLNTK
jgi:hypothetical protein